MWPNIYRDRSTRLEILVQHLLPGGKLIIFTGSTDAFTWRLAGVDYYYSAMPEHLAFMRPSWFKWAAAQLDCEMVSLKRLRYQSSSVSQRVDEAFRNLFVHWVSSRAPVIVGSRRLAGVAAGQARGKMAGMLVDFGARPHAGGFDQKQVKQFGDK
jgi:hypothetical protein